MITRFAIRRKSDGAFLSTRRAGAGRCWVKHIDDAALLKRRGDCTLAMYHIPEVKKYMEAARIRWVGSLYGRSEFPLEVVQFNVLLIDASKGYIG